MVLSTTGGNEAAHNAAGTVHSGARRAVGVCTTHVVPTRRRMATIIGCALVTCALAACGGGAVSYKDGTYIGESSVFEDSEDGNGNGYGVATVTIADGAITDCEFVTYEPDGTLKDEDYGKAGGAIANQDYYNKAQRAVAACEEYAAKLVAVGSLDGVDVISGATISYGEFQEAVQAALDQAAE